MTFSRKGERVAAEQRLPVRLLLTDKDHALRPGMMVEVSIAIRNH